MCLESENVDGLSIILIFTVIVVLWLGALLLVCVTVECYAGDRSVILYTHLSLPVFGPYTQC